MALFRLLARPEGFEPPTTWFEARYSIQLSYGRAGEADSRPFAPFGAALLANCAMSGQTLAPRRSRNPRHGEARRSVPSRSSRVTLAFRRCEMTKSEQRLLMRGVAAGTMIGLAIGLMIALFIAMKPELFAGLFQ